MLSQSSCSRVDLVFDQYRKQSIKEGERHKRGETSSLEFQIYSDSRPIPKEWGKYISNPRNKENLADFLCCALCKRFTQSLNPQQKVFLAGGFKDGMKTVSCTQGHREIVPLPRSDHEEADTRLLHQAKHASQTHLRIGLLQLTITWYKIRHAGGQAHYYSPTGTLKQRQVKLDWFRFLCFNVPVGE